LVIGALAAATIVVAGMMLTRDDSSEYRVAAIFDTAHGIIAGNDVKVAGVSVGSIDSVGLAPGPKARVVMSMSRNVGSFHGDATCTILPQGLISENFVQCDPGSVRSGPLARGTGDLPTVPVQRTTAPASLQQLLDVFSLPVDDRIRVVLTELGIGTLGRGSDIDAILRRSNPALDQARRVLNIVDAQRRQLASGIGETRQILASLARDNEATRTFVDKAAAVAETSADHRGALSAAINRLPAMLDAVRPGLQALDRVVNTAPPLLRDLRSAAPVLTTTTSELPPFSSAAVSALTGVGSAARVAKDAVRVANPIVTDLRQASRRALPFSRDLDALLVSLRDSGGFEGVLRLLYTFATFGAGYDGISHAWTIAIEPLGQCFVPGEGAPGCSTKYSAPGNGTIPANSPSCGPHGGATWDPPTNCTAVAGIGQRRAHAKHPKAPRQRRPRPANPAPVAAPPTSSDPRQPTDTVQGLLNQILGTSTQPGLVPQLLGTPTTLGTTQPLLDYLLGK
jgi:phospholipid/cholesterol/gamma-HCH transport system substrate-binding protein